MGLKVWTNTSFTGHWPVGTAAVIVSETKQGAENALLAELKKIGLPIKPSEIERMDLVPMEEGTAIVLLDGNY